MEYINNVLQLLQPIQGNLQNGQQVNKIHRRILRDTLSINEEYLIILDLISNSMSILGILFIWIVYFKYRKELNSPSYKMILFLQTTDFLFSVSQIMNFDYVDGEQNKVLCYMQGFLSTYAGLGSILWTMAISFTMKSALLSDTTNLLKNQKISTYICYGVPLLMSLIPVITDDYGPAGVICWIDDSQNPTRVLILRMLTFYGPLWIAITYNFYTYITLIRYLKTVVDQESDQLQFVKNLMYYPFILVICWIFGTFNRIYVFFDDEIEIVSALHLFFGGLMGFFNALVYGFSGQAKKIIKDKCCVCIFGYFVNKKQKNKKQSSKSEKSQAQIELNTQFDTKSQNDESDNDSRNPSQQFDDKSIYDRSRAQSNFSYIQSLNESGLQIVNI